ncbi:aminoacyl-histidine dipeptidase [Paludibacter propionicigenes WB4]|uniref:Cytosol non-specific dipeptidase n=1 Tax=Paludibacter propionicigenes (strain DSM 17365 / JCM 13257 / WB4) TaxID=694427 RepID=E4T749_PALPW|nr:aminoacyl-histidine dipeptidase [Paludibacter propionicigenes]ADQ80543.1 aminoacyl-histidine dipeptidase [Paludibacter propionicigenes WB4]
MKTLEPKALWNFFHEINQIPRPSKKEEHVIAYLKSFGENYNLTTKVDAAGNVLISKPATKGFEDRTAIILQAHMDMVCEKNSDIDFDFETDAIQAYVDGDWVKAKGTTLGADNGIGMSMMLSVLSDDSLLHPAIECLFTVDEETGLTGAFALEPNFLTGKILINLDSEDDGEIFVGCAGGIDTTAVLSYQADPTPENYFAFSVSIKGLKGGHSGDDIDKGLGNANKILNRFLWTLNGQMDLRLSNFDGGNLRNAIAREATATACVPFSEKERVRILFNHFTNDIENEKGSVEPKIRLELESETLPEKLIDKKTSDALLDALYACPHGVIAMSPDMPGLVETSTNLASVKMQDNQTILITTSQRSSVESSKYDIANQVKAVFSLSGATVTQGDGYPGWKPNLNSGILETAKNSYIKLFGQQPKIRAIHAGLECGLFLEKYPFLDMISIGPQMYGVHSPDERLSISSSQKCWEWLVDILAFERGH